VFSVSCHEISSAHGSVFPQNRSFPPSDENPRLAPTSRHVQAAVRLGRLRSRFRRFIRRRLRIQQLDVQRTAMMDCRHSDERWGVSTNLCPVGDAHPEAQWRANRALGLFRSRASATITLSCGFAEPVPPAHFGKAVTSHTEAQFQNHT
jgi:hypothetical protein